MDPVERLTKAARELVDAISFDGPKDGRDAWLAPVGRLIDGVWMGGNGGLVSRATHEKADAVRRTLDCLERQPQSERSTP